MRERSSDSEHRPNVRTFIGIYVTSSHGAYNIGIQLTRLPLRLAMWCRGSFQARLLCVDINTNPCAVGAFGGHSSGTRDNPQFWVAHQSLGSSAVNDF